MSMKFVKIIILLFIFPIVLSSSSHKFYVSTTSIEYVKEKQVLQVIAKIFTEDIEKALQERYNPSITLDSKKESKKDEDFLLKYLLQKIKIKVNGNPVSLNFIGKEYDIDITKVYFEAEDILEVKSIEIENKVLIDMFPEQQNIIHLKTTENRRSIILNRANPKGVLNFK